MKDTGLGNVEDKVTKNQRKTFGTLRDLLRVKTEGVIEEDREKSIVKHAKPVGVVAAITPSTDPSATPVNKAMMAVKGGNAVINSPSPAGWSTTAFTVTLMREGLEPVGAPADLVQLLPQPVSRSLTRLLMARADLVVRPVRKTMSRLPTAVEHPPSAWVRVTCRWLSTRPRTSLMPRPRSVPQSVSIMQPRVRRRVR